MKLVTAVCTLYFLCLPVHTYPADYLELAVPGKRIQLPEESWSLIKDEANFAQTYEQKESRESHKYGRVVTVFLARMPNDRKVGQKISDNEYLDILVVHDGLVTAQVKVDKGQYWVMSRETFVPKARLSADVSSNKRYLSELAKMSLWMDYRPEVDETRHLLQTVF
jgi:hypothetical protein